MSIDRLKTVVPLPLERPAKREPEAWASAETFVYPASGGL
jgi:hypothetical protein